MDRQHYEEMAANLNVLEQEGFLQTKNMFLFGHCNATEELANLLIEKGCKVRAILDNNVSKQGTDYRGIPIEAPKEVLLSEPDDTVICIVARAYAAMAKQLQQMGFRGRVEKLVDYNSYAEYSLSDETIERKQKRVRRGEYLLRQAEEKYQGFYRIYCPFSALGDVYYMMSYLSYYLAKKETDRYVIFTIGKACAEVARMFGAEHVEACSQKNMDEQIQAVLYAGESNAFIPHQDRPYVANLYKALYIKKIPLEMIYKYGVFALSKECEPCRPVKLGQYEKLSEIPQGKAVILSPHAKSVTNIGDVYWRQIIQYYKEKEYEVYTNVAGEETVLEGTKRLEVPLAQLQSVVERAGIFIGLRSGLCDVLKWADCKKIALYPDCYYSDTKWKMEEMYHLEGWENIVV